MRGWLAVLLLAAPCTGAFADETALQKEIAALRAQVAALQTENAQLKALVAGGTNKAVADKTERQEEKPANRIRLPSNVTINHNPR